MALLLQGYHGAIMLSEARNNHEEFCIPICVLPATISNDIPGSDISIGCDTALNVIVEVRDLLLQFLLCFA
jgi:6-phosphofructokinase 1